MQGIYLEELGLKFVKTCLSTYLGELYFFGIFIACIILFITHTNKTQKYISIYTFFLFSTIFNPFLVKIVFGYFGMDEVYYRFFWLLPINIIVAYLGTYCISKFSGYAKKAIMAMAIFCIVLLMGNPSISPSTLLTMPDNLYKVSDEILEISECIHQSSDEKNPSVAVAPDLIMTIRQYDASLQLTLYRDIVLCWQGMSLFQEWATNDLYQLQKPIMDVIYGGDTSNPEAFQQSMASTSTQYLVFSKDIDIQAFLQELGAQYIAETTSYVIYKYY